jgi:hypothetical protein
VMVEVLVDEEACVLVVAAEACLEVVAWTDVAAVASVDSAAAQGIEEMDGDLVATEAGQVEDQEDQV